MGQRWIESWIDTIVQENDGDERDDLKQQHRNNKPMLAAIVRVKIKRLPRNEREIRLSMQKYQRNRPMDSWKGA